MLNENIILKLRGFSFLLVVLLIHSEAFGQCALPDTNMLFIESFENGFPPQWSFPETSDGGNWQINDQKLAIFGNPGSSNWVYVNDESENDIGKAEMLSPTINLTSSSNEYYIQFDLLFQTYLNAGYVSLEALDGETWIELYREDHDFQGTIEIGLKNWESPSIQFRFIYSDGDEWGWGMGIDNFSVLTFEELCGNGICDRGEGPDTCPDDCIVAEENPHWTQLGYDLEGNRVDYIEFKGGTNCDDCSEEINLGFDFSFFEEKYNVVFLNSNGNLTLLNSYSEYTPQPFCLEGPKMIAPFYADVDLTSEGKLYYYHDSENQYLLVTWLEVPYFGCVEDCEMRNQFQLVLSSGKNLDIQGNSMPQGANVAFIYENMTWTTGASSGGLKGYSGSAATIGLNQGNGSNCQDYGTFDHPGFDYYGNTQTEFCPPNGVDHLDYKTIFFNATSGQEVNPELENLNFAATAVENGFELSWDPIELLVSSYTIQRKLKGDAWTSITSFGGGEASQYSYRDITGDQQGIWLYRLQVENDNGKIWYSNEIEIANNSNTEINSTPNVNLELIGPNPFQEDINFTYSLLKNVDTYVIITDMSGKMLIRKDLGKLVGVYSERLALGQLSTGNYIFSIYSGDEIITKTLVKR